MQKEYLKRVLFFMILFKIQHYNYIEIQMPLESYRLQNIFL